MGPNFNHTTAPFESFTDTQEKSTTILSPQKHYLCLLHICI